MPNLPPKQNYFAIYMPSPEMDTNEKKRNSQEKKDHLELSLLYNHLMAPGDMDLAKRIEH